MFQFIVFVFVSFWNMFYFILFLVFTCLGLLVFCKYFLEAVLEILLSVLFLFFLEDVGC